MARVLITGTNKGIGLEMCRQLKARGDEVIGACRTPSGELEELGIRVITGVDVTDEASVRALADELSGIVIDVLVNNAGLLTIENFDGLDYGRMKLQYDVNALGPLRVTHALQGNLREGSKVIIISSRVGSIADNGRGGTYGYRMSKAAVNMAGMNLAIDFRERGIPVALLHPGLVATEMTDWTGIPPEESAAGLIARIDELDMDSTGCFRHANGETLPW